MTHTYSELSIAKLYSYSYFNTIVSIPPIVGFLHVLFSGIYTNILVWKELQYTVHLFTWVLHDDYPLLPLICGRYLSYDLTRRITIFVALICNIPRGNATDSRHVSFISQQNCFINSWASSKIFWVCETVWWYVGSTITFVCLRWFLLLSCMGNHHSSTICRISIMFSSFPTTLSKPKIIKFWVLSPSRTSCYPQTSRKYLLRRGFRHALGLQNSRCLDV